MPKVDSYLFESIPCLIGAPSIECPAPGQFSNVTEDTPADGIDLNARLLEQSVQFAVRIAAAVLLPIRDYQESDLE